MESLTSPLTSNSVPSEPVPIMANPVVNPAAVPPGAHVMTVGVPFSTVNMPQDRAQRRVTSSNVITWGFYLVTIAGVFAEIGTYFPNQSWIAATSKILFAIGGAFASIGQRWLTMQRQTDADTLENTNLVTPPVPVSAGQNE